MTQMFEGATRFNQPLNNWNVSNVRYMGSMFENTTSFNQPLHAPWYNHEESESDEESIGWQNVNGTGHLRPT